jgi:hypothetical protein
MDSIDVARTALIAAEDNLDYAIRNNYSANTTDNLAEQVDRLEKAYFRAVDFWQPVP